MHVSSYMPSVSQDDPTCSSLLEQVTTKTSVTSWMKDSTLRNALRSVVGTLWSTVTRVQSGRRTRLPALLRPSNACGEVTSCTRCLSTYISDPESPPSSTRCCSQILSNIVFAANITDEVGPRPEPYLFESCKSMLQVMNIV
jgi:hypothetical protein